MKTVFPYLRSRVTSRRWLALGLSALGLVACGGGGSGNAGDEVEPGAFLAFQSHFLGFHDWEAFPVADFPGATDAGTGDPGTTDDAGSIVDDAGTPVDDAGAPIDGATTNPHTGNQRVAYLNHRPPAGSTEYPTGTIIVKEVHQSSGKIDVVARAKRGGTYNARGATGWEWFELSTATPNTLTILWRGVGPPAGESYLGNVEGGCNACHRGARDDDSILLPALRPSSF